MTQNEIHLRQSTTLTLEQYVVGLTDFGPGRSKLFGNSADEYLKVHSRGSFEADVTEGSGGIWERLTRTRSKRNHLGRPRQISSASFNRTAACLFRGSSRNSRRRRPAESGIHSRKRAQSTTTSSPPCAMTSLAPVGATATRYGPAPPKRGNCTDFHSLFIGMMRAAGIPARFEIGFPLPADQHDGPIPGYHCWAQFYVEPYGWIPVDASEAWKHPDKKDYFFGAHDDNRLQFTVGRDIRLNPAQQSDPLNYFIYPYAELDGKPFALESKFSFRDRMSGSD
jgi:Transglutaminase-like superfamily